MGILSPFASPHDIRWQGLQRHHHAIFLVENAILLLFIILVIVEYLLFKAWWENGPYDYHKNWEWAPYVPVDLRARSSLLKIVPAIISGSA